ncbi:CDP-glycerol glycerophosphotransferase family protein [Leucobacter aridicollis]|uniref:CDP-glycerol glycerophosphotransferase (TagB/SpsB family) n=1 Tax=Leucobacter aridicollis TaxID=283878 RepID=A0A852R398_9MICO|nr:CDP-glycerol glycerophosphotransferase family protein [Leucobacter aridicollis]NYD25448.1 CDP-glycerol glycerophosphotransferase (TagB/SpsB family) [Leucobacter aridicollis]
MIIPVFNGEKYLERCLDSVLGQTMPDFEVIIVDDGSTDASPQILHDYASRFPVIRVIRQENAGQGAARNTALAQARGVYILFVDADDLIERVTLQVTTERAELDQSDLVHFDWKFIKTKPDHLGKYDYYNIEPFWHQRMLEGAECEQLFRMHSYFSVTNLYRRSFLEEHGLRYEEGQIYEDNPFLAQVFSLAQSVSLVHSPLYAIQANPQSSTKVGADTPRHMRDHLSAVRKSFERLSPRFETTLGDLAEYHLEKFSIYYGRRVPPALREEYAREFVALLGAQELRFGVFGRKTSWLTKLCLKLGVFERQRYAVLQRLVESKDRLAPPAKKTISAARKIKRRLRHPVRTMNTVISGKTPKVRPGTILFLGFDYRYTGNSRALFEELRADERFAERKILFATVDTRVPAEFRVRPESIAFTRAAQHSEFVIAETWVPASIQKNPGSKWIQLWHGTPIKRMLFDSHEREITKARPAHKVNKYKDIQRWDYFVVDGDLAAERFSTAFLLEEKAMLRAQYPRVSRLSRYRKSRSEAALPLRETAQGLNHGLSFVALYAPTWRDRNYRASQENHDSSYLLDLQELSAKLGERWQIIFKDHDYLAAQRENEVEQNIHVSSDDIEDLLAVADVLITDYSSVEFDAVSVGLPVLHHVVDRDDFVGERGLYSVPVTDGSLVASNHVSALALACSQSVNPRPGDAEPKPENKEHLGKLLLCWGHGLADERGPN